MTTGKIFFLFIIWQLVIVGVTLLSPNFLPLRQTFLGGATQAYMETPLLYSRANFDGIHYTNIAYRGYGYAQQAFFPLYPQLIKFLFPLFGTYVVPGVLISSLSFILSLVVLNKLIMLEHNKNVSKWTIYLLFFFPVSFYFTFMYTEGLFFLLVLLSFYFARTKRWWLAGICGGLSAYTRLVGVALFPALVYELVISADKKRFTNSIPLLFIPAGLLVYMWHLQQTMGDPLAFLHVQKLFSQGRSDQLILIYQVIWRYIKMVFTVNRADPLYLTILFEFAAGIVFSVLAVYSLFKQRLSYNIFNFVCVFLPPLTGSFTSMPRYVLVAFPSFILLGQMLSQTPKKIRTAIFCVLFLLFSLYLTLFVRGYWVA